jgi:hypothetical protein
MTARWRYLPKKFAKSVSVTAIQAIAILMAHPGLSPSFRLFPEQRLSIDLAEAMRRHTLSGGYKGIWFCVQNEAKRHRITALIQKAMGLIPGVSDFVFIWESGALLAELKAGANDQTENQQYFQLWCSHCRLPYGVFRDVETVEARLRTLGALA